MSLATNSFIVSTSSQGPLPYGSFDFAQDRRGSEDFHIVPSIRGHGLGSLERGAECMPGKRRALDPDGKLLDPGEDCELAQLRSFRFLHLAAGDQLMEYLEERVGF